MWTALAAILGGMLPALLVTIAFVALIYYVWLGLGYAALRSGGAAFGIFCTLSLLLHLRREVTWKGTARAESSAHGESRWRCFYWTCATATTGAGGVLACCFQANWQTAAPWGWLRPAGQAPVFHTWGYAPSVAWSVLALAVALFWNFLEAICRAWESRQIPVGEAARILRRDELHERRLRRGIVRDQVASRYLAWAVIAAAVALIWDLALQLATAKPVTAVQSTGTLTAVFTALYLWLRDWLAKPDKQTQGGTLLRRAMERAKPLMPMAAATGGALSLILFSVLLVQLYGLGPALHPASALPSQAAVLRYFGCGSGVAVILVFIALKIFDPAHFGLHDFYRSRIARAFLGAAFLPGQAWRARFNEARLEWTQTVDANIASASEADEARHKLDTPALTGEERKKWTASLRNAESREAYTRDFLERSSARWSSRPSAADNRFTVERWQDDLYLEDLPESRAALGPDAHNELLRRLRLRPVHLICCAANHLTGDALATLSRGARSVVLSQRGISLGSDTCPPHSHEAPLTLSGALTASAAAFNSQMGEKSLRLGPASSFLMSALNLRLGLWVLNPARVRLSSDSILYHKVILRRRRAERIGKQWCRHPWLTLWQKAEKLLFDFDRWRAESRLWHACFDAPGAAFFMELLSRSNASADDPARQLHLSDGGHFENLGLYELIRRHTRYIIVSDAGQDEEVAFDDLGNATRRVREDFGVEIEIELSPIRPNAKLESRQHLVVGTIHYDGYAGCDKGTLVYLKPTLTGDEPGDIQQYRCRNTLFPHEPTSDQFFSEAQWESYRRLGEHVGQIAFTFLDLMSPEQRTQPETVFRQVRRVWSVLPPELEKAAEAIMAKLTSFDAEVSAQAPVSLRAELWPEVAAVYGVRSPAPFVPSGAWSQDPPDQVANRTAVVAYLVRVLHLMEEAWRALRLSEFWAHPDHDGVMNCFRRWWATPSLRCWWVPLSSLCCDDFREFIKINFNLRARDPVGRKTDAGRPGPVLKLRRAKNPGLLVGGVAWTQMRQRKWRIPPTATIYEYTLNLEEAGGAAVPLQVGIALVRLAREAIQGRPRLVARWEGQNLFVPESLSGAGLKSRFLDRLLWQMKGMKVAQIVVTLRDEFPGRRDEASRQLRLAVMGFYKSRGFEVHSTSAEDIFAEMRLDFT